MEHPALAFTETLRKLSEEAYAAGEVPIAAAAYNDSGILSACYNRTRTDRNAIQHAEMQCIAECCAQLKNERLVGVRLISVLEPCLMCGGAIIEARIEEVIYYCPATHGPSLSDLLSDEFAETFKKDKGINHKPVLTHLTELEAEFSERIREFFRSRRT